MRFFTADLHLGHANVIGYCARPFADVGAMDDALVAGWCDTVGGHDEVWVLGDMALGRLEDSLARVAELPGRLVLVPGNHDRCFAGHPERRRRGWEQRYLDAGFDEVVYDPAALELSGTRVQVCHFPYEGDSRDQDRFGQFRPTDTGGWLLHGHVHQHWRQRGRMVNVGVDAWAGRPVSEEVIVELIAAGAGDLGPLPWTAA